MNKSGSLCPSSQGLASYLGRTVEPPETSQESGSSHLDRKESSYLCVHVWSSQRCQDIQDVCLSPPHFLWLFCFSRKVAGNNGGAPLFPMDMCRSFPAFSAQWRHWACLQWKKCGNKTNMGAVAARKAHLQSSSFSSLSPSVSCTSKTLYYSWLPIICFLQCLNKPRSTALCARHSKTC